MDKALENEIKSYMASRIAEGISLSDIQTEVNEKFGQKYTYMDIRILASTLDIDWQAKGQEKKAEEKPAQAEKPAAEELPAENEAPSAPAGAAPGAGRTVVEVSKLMRPGTALSGTVKFASGSTADWYIDQTGRLGLENLQGERPTQEDIQQFQTELERAVYGGR
ncbi:MAG: hypothetical protein IJS01_06040 [Lentisphaeria bacterium]|nr:hypothetical protein [Lentisphaeria bacterium]